MIKDIYATIFVGGRATGKTTRLLERANRTSLPIIAHNQNMKRYLEREAASRRLLNVKVWTLEEFKMRKLAGIEMAKEVLVDEAQLMLESVIGERVRAMTVATYDLHNFEIAEETNKPINSGMRQLNVYTEGNPSLVFVQDGDKCRIYQDGKELKGVRRITIDACAGEQTTHTVEYLTGHTE